MTRMLASVTGAGEAVMALEAGVDIIDLKDPKRGALGALDPLIASQVVQAVGTFAITSATVGDFPAMQPDQVLSAAQDTARLGVTYVKVGIWTDNVEPSPCVRALAALARHTRLVAVLFADQPTPPALIDELHQAGFSGVMLDTAQKSGPPLRELKSEIELALFVRRVRAQGMLCGLAGKLRLPDIAPLRTLQPDYLGFRGALCAQGTRAAELDARALAEVCAAVHGRERRALAARAMQRAQ